MEITTKNVIHLWLLYMQYDRVTRHRNHRSHTFFSSKVIVPRIRRGQIVVPGGSTASVPHGRARSAEEPIGASSAARDRGQPARFPVVDYRGRDEHKEQDDEKPDADGGRDATVTRVQLRARDALGARNTNAVDHHGRLNGPALHRFVVLAVACHKVPLPLGLLIDRDRVRPLDARVQLPPGLAVRLAALGRWR